MNNEKLSYTAPEAEIELLEEKDIVLVSVIDGEDDLDSKSKKFGSW